LNRNSQNTDDTDLFETTRISKKALSAYPCCFRVSVFSVFWLLLFACAFAFAFAAAATAAAPSSRRR
jgi:hypothetical protein